MSEADFRAEAVYGGCLTILRRMLSEGIITGDEMKAAEHIVRLHNNPVIALISPCINLN